MKPLVGLLALVASSTAFAQYGLMPTGATSNVQFAPLAQGNDLATGSSGVYVFNEPNSFANYWATNHRGPGPMLQNDFFQHWRIVAIHLGSRPAGSSLAVTSVVRRIDRAVINAIETVPPARRNDSGRNDRSGRRQAMNVSPWLLLRVERGAFDLSLQTRQVQGYGVVDGGGGGRGVSTVKTGGVTIYFPGRG